MLYNYTVYFVKVLFLPLDEAWDDKDNDYVINDDAVFQWGGFFCNLSIYSGWLFVVGDDDDDDDGDYVLRQLRLWRCVVVAVVCDDEFKISVVNIDDDEVVRMYFDDADGNGVDLIMIIIILTILIVKIAMMR